MSLVIKAFAIAGSDYFIARGVSAAGQIVIESRICLDASICVDEIVEWCRVNRPSWEVSA